MNAPRIVLLSAFLFVVASLSATAQEQEPMTPGDRVRVTLPLRSLVGTLVSPEPDTCVVQMTGAADPLFVPLGDLTKLEVYRGRKTSLLRGVAFGLVGGAGYAALGAGTCALLTAGSEGDPGEVAGGCAWYLGIVGLFGGLIAGTLVTKPYWEEVPLDRLRVGPSPVTADGVRVTVLVHWSVRR